MAMRNSKCLICPRHHTSNFFIKTGKGRGRVKRHDAERRRCSQSLWEICEKLGMKKYGYTLYSLLKTSHSYMINSSYRPRDIIISGYFIFHISPTFPHICLFHVDHNTLRSLLYHLILRPMKVQVYEKYTQYCGNRVVGCKPIRDNDKN